MNSNFSGPMIPALTGYSMFYMQIITVLQLGVYKLYSLLKKEMTPTRPDYS